MPESNPIWRKKARFFFILKNGLDNKFLGERRHYGGFQWKQWKSVEI
jgi:hypothetical protein